MAELMGREFYKSILLLALRFFFNVSAMRARFLFPKFEISVVQ